VEGGHAIHDMYQNALNCLFHFCAIANQHSTDYKNFGRDF